MNVTGVIKDITNYADNAISFAEKLSVYDSATENGTYNEIVDIVTHGLFAWIGIIGEQTVTAELGKTKIRNIETPSVTSSETELIILIANMIGG